jgi:DNA primase
MLTNQDGAPAEVIFTFDPDAAGQKAAMRAFSDSSKFKADTFVAVGPDGLDPCDLRTTHGDEAVNRMISSRRPLFEFAIRQKIAMFNVETIEGQVGAIRAAAPIVAAIPEPAMRSAYTRKLIEWVPFDENQVQAMVVEAAKTNRSIAVANLRVELPKSAASDASSSESPIDSAFPEVDLKDPINRNERAILEVLLQLTDRCSPAELVEIASGAFSAPAHSAIAKAIAESVPLGLKDFLGNVSSRVPAELQGLVRQIAATNISVDTSDEAKLERYLRGVLNSARQIIAVKKKATAMAKLRAIDRQTDPGGFDAIRLELAAIDGELQNLKQA